MPDRAAQVSLPFGPLPTTDGVRTAIANVIRDIQREHDLTDLQLAAKIEVHPNTISRARNKQGTLDNEAMAKLGAVYGPEAMRPYTVLWEREATDGDDVMLTLGRAVAALAAAKGPKGRMDALPTIKDCIEALNALVIATERDRLRLVG